MRVIVRVLRVLGLLGVLGPWFGLAFAAAAARAETVAPNQAQAHVGQIVTVEGTVSEVYTGNSGTTFLDIGGAYPNNAFAAVIFKDDSGKFRDVDTLGGKTVDVTGAIRLYRGRAEIVVSDPAQIKTK
jgi:DNA/RNA endonuclease YhcR with UshA esterase domain